MAASTPTTSEDELAAAGGRGPAAAGVQARQPRIHAAMPFESSSAPPSPPWPEPSRSATLRSAS